MKEFYKKELAKLMTEDELKAQTVSELSDMALEDSDECTDDYQDSDDDIYEIDMYGDVWRSYHFFCLDTLSLN
jgi:hypothetical protein